MSDDVLADLLEGKEKWETCPFFPTDVFAVAGYLLKIGGAISFFEPSPYKMDSELLTGQFAFGTEERKEIDNAGRLWREAPRGGGPGSLPQIVQDLWDILLDEWGEPITPGKYLHEDNEAAPWWEAALKLMMIADMACTRLVTDPIPDNPLSPFEEFVVSLYEDYWTKKAENRSQLPPATLCFLADSAIVCVLPKIRVAAVGATLRNVSRNLCLLPGRGEVRCSWHTPTEVANEDLDTLDILLIPEPATIKATDFESCAEPEKRASDLHRDKPNWENFRVSQNWITGPDAKATKKKKKKFVKKCVALLAQAKSQSRAVNGVVLPEYAITYDVFETLCQALKKAAPELEFVISGSSSSCTSDSQSTPRKANHVLTRVWDGAELSAYETTSRTKHHRWRMDRSQVQTYALSSSLNPKVKNWWEDTPLGRRELHFHRFRNRSVFSVLICEELARSDPCHEIIRSVAPNLVFALLMDGPQIRERWPAQYATNLADDPGSSVLTFTSFGLIGRANAQCHHAENRSIALWKDESGKVVQLEMPKGGGDRAVLLSLWSEHAEDRTITGKKATARSWRYSSHFPIVV